MRPNPNRGHLLLPLEIADRLPPIGSTENLGAAAPVIVKFFSPYSGWTWYVTEGQKEATDTDEEDYLFFGLVVGLETELGYFCLSELESATKMRGKLPLIERDCDFSGDHVVGEFMK